MKFFNRDSAEKIHTKDARKNSWDLSADSQLLTSK